MLNGGGGVLFAKRSGVESCDFWRSPTCGARTGIRVSLEPESSFNLELFVKMSALSQETPTVICKHYLIPVMQRGPRPPPAGPHVCGNWSPLHWQEQRAALGPCPSHCCPSPPHNKRGHGAFIPRQRYKWWPPDSRGWSGVWNRTGFEGKKNGKGVMKELPSIAPPTPRGPFVGQGWGDMGVWGLRRLQPEETKDRSEGVTGVKTATHPFHTSTESLSNRYPIVTPPGRPGRLPSQPRTSGARVSPRNISSDGEKPCMKESTCGRCC